MGLDTVELVISFEETFGIAIPDDVAVQLTTPRRVTDYIMTQVVVSEESSCLSQQAFYFLRGRLVPSLNISRKELAPNTRLENLFPLENRQLGWAHLRSQIRPALVPDLARPTWLFCLLSLITVLAFFYALIHATNSFKIGTAFGFFFGLAVALVLGFSGAVLTRPFKRNFGRGYVSVGDLAKHISVYSPHAFKKENRGWTREQVAALVREIIIDQVGKKDFTEDSHFIDDMHLD